VSAAPGNASLRARIREFLQGIARPGVDLAAVADDSNLFDAGALDSLAAAQIIVYLETEHGAAFAGGAFDPDELATVAGISRLAGGS
jgi:acyl carrier protein